jgi:tryptophanyl-tRNA synthetase
MEVRALPDDAFKVTPWEVEGTVDYARLIKQFGVDPLNGAMLERLKKAAGGELHHLLRREYFISHRELGWVLDEYAKKNPFFLYTGRGPSGPIHLGHLIPWIATQWLQEKFNVDVYFQLTDDEKFLFSEKLTLEDTAKWTVENALDFLALGYKPGKTHLIWDTRHAGVMYPQAIRVAKKLNYSTAKAVFGFEGSSNVGEIFYTSMQSVPAFLPSVLAGKNIPCLVPMGIDQDPHFRIARDILPKLGYLKPAALHSKLLPGLTSPGTTKMSASDPNSAIYTDETPKQVRNKVMKYAFSGGKATTEEHRKKGGDTNVDASYRWLSLFEPDDRKIEKIGEEYRSGKLLSGEMKQLFVDHINAFLEKHQARREALRPRLDDFMLKV